MLTAVLITLTLTAALTYAMRAGGRGRLIVHRPYNNRYNDAAGARQDAASR
jgi:hypothetical protein